MLFLIFVFPCSHEAEISLSVSLWSCLSTIWCALWNWNDSPELARFSLFNFFSSSFSSSSPSRWPTAQNKARRGQLHLSPQAQIRFSALLVQILRFWLRFDWSQCRAWKIFSAFSLLTPATRARSLGLPSAVIQTYRNGIIFPLTCPWNPWNGNHGNNRNCSEAQLLECVLFFSDLSCGRFLFFYYSGFYSSSLRDSRLCYST